MDNNGLNEDTSKNTANKSCDETSENFQQFIYDLFEKNGILNDLRAYLRSQIVNVLKSASSGDPSPCLKNFAQRLEPTYQAINILIAEYFMKLDLSYTLSIFVSEIPLANMFFDFAKSLLKSSETFDFKVSLEEKDVWAVLNYLGVKCDSSYTNKLLSMYKSNDLPLLECIFKCVPMVDNTLPYLENDKTSEEYILSSDKSADIIDEKHRGHSERYSHRHCKHYSICKTCHSKMYRLKEKLKRKQRHFVEREKSSDHSPDVSSLMKNVSVIEKGIINEMFEQLKTVYEAEVEMIRDEHQNRLLESVNSHAAEIEKQRDELEESYKAREAELLKNVEEKKRFLWGLAKSLRQQHEHVARAMQEISDETQRLTVQEQSIKKQMQDAEELLVRRGEEMRQQITQELQVMELNLLTLKKERDTLTTEKLELEQLKMNNTNLNNPDLEDLKKDYELLKEELRMLKKYLEVVNMCPKCRKGTDDESSDANCVVNNLVMNSDCVKDRVIVSSARLNNDLKVQKNVNFNLSQEEVYREKNNHGHSTSSLHARDRHGQGCDRDECDHDCCQIRHLKEENEQLKVLARQQSDHIACLRRQQTRPQSAPIHTTYEFGRLNTCLSRGNSVNPCGGGEQLNAFLMARPLVLLPSDTVPFIGPMRDRPAKTKHVNHWHSLRERDIATKVVPSRDSQRSDMHTGDPVSTSRDARYEDDASGERDAYNKKPTRIAEYKSRDKSPKSVLKEAKDKLRHKNIAKDLPAVHHRDQGPSNALREAKLRLRKLEIEAEAVHNSYQEFKRRQEERRCQNDESVSNIGTKISTSLTELEQSRRIVDVQKNLKEHHDIIKRDFNKYLRNYKTKFDIPSFKNKNGISELIHPIPKSFTDFDKNESNTQIHVNYLETPLIEFRKLYHADKNREKTKNDFKESIYDTYQTVDEICNESNDKITKLEELKDNLRKTYTFSSPTLIQNVETSTPHSELDAQKVNICVVEEKNEEYTKETNDLKPRTEENLLRVDIENVCETNSVTVSPKEDLVVMVEGSIDSKDILESDDDKKISTQMTIFLSPKIKNDSNDLHSDVHKVTDKETIDAIFHANTEEVSSVDMQLNLSKVDVNDDKAEEDYPDDFSADVDNYNSPSEYEQNSPISFAKYSEDNLWD
ncbi:myosin-9-like isoform X2 [Leptidea sinapis]|uniref:myosin-9-like isoform X2 n=1 Tax=Leptidea sinapis TaxID=189913 RepID=UPI0021C3F883|nr:myosin-9-like isoform X2 [Leptidea sinapis]